MLVDELHRGFVGEFVGGGGGGDVGGGGDAEDGCAPGPDAVLPLVEAVERLTTVDADTLSDGELGDVLVELHRQQARLAAVAARFTGAFDARRAWADDGSRTCAAWLAHRCRVPVGQARAEVRLGRRLRSMPATSEAFAAGEVSAAHAERLAGLNGPRTAAAFAEAEAMLVGYARTMSWPDFCRALAYWHQIADPDGVEADAADDESLRRVHLSTGMNGTGILDGVLTPLGRATVGGALERIERELFEADWAEARDRCGDATTAGDLPRTPAQRRHDALVEMAVRATTAPKDGKRPRPLVSILCGYETFAGRVCELADGTVVVPGVVAGLLDRALVERIVFDAPSRVVDVGRARLFTGALRRAVEVRDRHCTHPGCDTPADRCDVDHIQPYTRGGPTTQANGTLRCPGHHRHRHRTSDPDPESDPGADSDP